jgi:N-methylhydantoinase A
MWRIGVDSGGTFTDVCLFDDATGQVAVWKVSSTPADPSQGIGRGVEEGLAQVGAGAADVGYFGHGTTVATNALIQHRGVKTGLITTDGFRDLLEIGRQKRPDLYDMQADKPATLVPRDLRLEVPERMRHDGTVEVPLDEDAFRNAVRTLRAAGVEAVAVCFLYGFVSTAHEAAAARILAEEFPQAFASISHMVAPEFREFERLSTTVVNAYLGPVMHRYIGRLAERLTDLGVTAIPHLTQSNGGVIGFGQAARLPVRTVLSGPSTGVVGAQAIGRALGIGEIITFDMGGTSTDVALLAGGQCRLTGEAMVHGYPIKAPMLDIHTVGAGGGSIAFIDNGGLLKVGPRSAGADPGPVCYGRGNEEATVTDANVVLGTLNPAFLLGGRMPVRHDLAVAAIDRLASALGMERMATASGIISVVTANMARAIRVISVQRGHDPRDYTLVAFGGAGPLHAARLARELEIRRILVPRNPGILCAMGLLLTDLRADFAVTRLAVLASAALGGVRNAFRDLDVMAAEWFAAEAIADSNRRTARTVDMRYAGQNYELPIPLPDGDIGPATLRALAERFADAHRRMYGFAAEEDPVQLVTFRVEASGVVPKATFKAQANAGSDASPAIIGSRALWMSETGGFVACPVYDRDRLRAGNRFPGPAIVEQMDATTIVPLGWAARVEPFLNVILESV